MKSLAWLGLVVFFELACSKSPQSYVAQGNRFLAAGKYGDAEIQYRKSVVKNPKFAEGYYRLGVLEYRLHRGVEALSDLQRAVDFDPDNDRYAIELASVAIEAYQVMPGKKNLYDEASQEADALLKKDSNSFDGLRLRGDVLVVDRKYDEALADFEKANAMRPDDPNVTAAMAQILFAENRDQPGEQLLRHFLAVRKQDARAYDILEDHYARGGRLAEAESLLLSEASALPRDSRPRLQLANLYRTSGHAEQMSQELSKILGDPRDFPEGHAEVGDFYASSQKWDAALAEYRQGMQASAHKELYHPRMERALEALGKRQEAIGELDEMLKANPNDPEARLKRAVLLRESGFAKDRELACSELKALAAKYPQNEVVAYNLALSDLGQGDTAGAWKEARKSADLREDYIAPRLLEAEIAQTVHDYSTALQAANQVLVLDSSNWNGRLLRAAALIGNKSYRQAESELGDLSRLRPNSKEVVLELASLAAGEKEYPKAEALYQRLYQPGSGDLRPLQGLLQLSAAEGQPQKAQALLENEIKLQPNSQPLRLLLASLAAGEGKFDVASQQYRWLEEKEPKSPQPYSALGELYQKQGATEEALASYEKASSLAPNDTKILGAIAVIESNNGKPRQAIDTLNRELALDPGNLAAMNNLAFNLAETGTDLDRAQSLAENVARKFPNDAAVLDTLGWVYTKRGLNDSAIKVLRDLVTKHPNEPVYRYHLAVAYIQDKQSGDAKRELLAALQAHPTRDLSDRIQQNLTQVR